MKERTQAINKLFLCNIYKTISSDIYYIAKTNTPFSIQFARYDNNVNVQKNKGYLHSTEFTKITVYPYSDV